MNQLYVFNTYKDSLHFQVTNKQDDVVIVSLEEGAGRIKNTKGAAFDLIVFEKSNVENVDIVTYINLTEKFIKELKYYGLTHQETLFV
ncbi:hypothetical protein ACH6EH_06705 [Paenibacillus sp. JSM ZJ436]|uniref:hypothetical protein n=1 Tax=Paenibacillus sp. JSM ZJ436 TaxID=3376190 RepID=UPI00378FCF24